MSLSHVSSSFDRVTFKKSTERRPEIDREAPAKGLMGCCARRQLDYPPVRI